MPHNLEILITYWKDSNFDDIGLNKIYCYEVISLVFF